MKTATVHWRTQTDKPPVTRMLKQGNYTNSTKENTWLLHKDRQDYLFSIPAGNDCRM